MNLLLPVITTLREDRRERAYLAWVALSREVVRLPLDNAPADASTHVLEIHVVGDPGEPLVLLADPAGVPDAAGFPLQLRPLDDAQEAALQAELFAAKEDAPRAPPPAVPLQPSRPPPPMTSGQAAALLRASFTNEVDEPGPASGALSGRVLAGGRFVVEDLLGVGANGEVYRATHTSLSRQVAIKVLHGHLRTLPGYSRRFHAEALAASRLDHPNVLRVFDYGEDVDGLLYIAMELLSGENLLDLVSRGGPLPLSRILAVGVQACAGVAAAHAAGIVHRDLKPENIVVTRGTDDDGKEREIVKVCDFGIAHWTPPGGDGGHASTASFADRPAVAGTPAYMAPEQIRGEALTPRTDVYALGCVLFELATGRVPFPDEDPYRVIIRHVEEPAPRLTEIVAEASPALEEIVARCLSKRPEDRYADARALRAALRALSVDVTSTKSIAMQRVSMRKAVTPDALVASPHEAAELIASRDDGDDIALALDFAVLERSLRAAVANRAFADATALLQGLRKRLDDPLTRGGERELAERTLLGLRSPEVVEVLARTIVDATAPAAAVGQLLAAAGTAAAAALVELRRTTTPSLEERARIVSALRALGPSAVPPIAEALDAVRALGTRNEEGIAEDLLDAVPDVTSDAAGEVVSRLVRVDRPRVGARALRALASLWGSRAHPMLLAALDASDAQLRLAAITALAQLGLVDAWTVQRLLKTVGAASDSLEVRIAAARALVHAPEEARALAVSVLSERIASASGRMASLLSAIGRDSRDAPELLAAVAETLYRLAPDSAHALLERLAATLPELRPAVAALLTPGGAARA